jgi:hypothetical protein
MKLIAIDNIKSTNLTFVNLQGDSLIEIIKDKVYKSYTHNFMESDAPRRIFNSK